MSTNSTDRIVKLLDRKSTSCADCIDIFKNKEKEVPCFNDSNIMNRYSVTEYVKGCPNFKAFEEYLEYLEWEYNTELPD